MSTAERIAEKITPHLEMRHQGIARQLDLVPPSILDTHVNIVGAGAIGSWVALALAKSGFKKLAVFDFDDVDIVNMSSQFYGVSDIGRKKVECLAERIEEMTGEKIMPIAEAWNGLSMRGVTIMAADSMAVRKQIYEKHKGHLASDWLIDARMGAEHAILYTINPNATADQELYESTLYSDEAAVQERCTAKSTTFCAVILSGLVTKTVRDVLVKGKYIRNLQFSLKENDWIGFSVDMRSGTK